MFELTLASLSVMLVSLVGAFFISKSAGALLEKNLSLLVSFSAGVFLVIAYKLGVESSLVYILLGALIVLVFFKFLPSFHHHHNEGVEKRVHSKIDAHSILFSDALHNVGDGVLLAASFAASSFLGFVALINIVIHEVVQEVSEFFVLRQAGYSVRDALLANFATSATILIGSLGSYFFLGTFSGLEMALLGVASGSFLVVVFHDLIPHSVRASRSKHLYYKHLGWFLSGIALMVIVNIFTGH